MLWKHNTTDSSVTLWLFAPFFSPSLSLSPTIYIIIIIIFAVEMWLVGAFSAEGGKWGFRSGLSYLLIWMGTMMIGTQDDDYHEGGDDGDFGDDDF